MNRKRMRENIGQLLRLRPIATRKDGATQLPSLDDDWRLEQCTDTALELHNVRTQHVLHLGADHVHEFRTPNFLVLKAQVTISGNCVQIEPTPLNKEVVIQVIASLSDEERDRLLLQQGSPVSARSALATAESSEAVLRTEFEALKQNLLEAQRRVEGLQTGGDTFCYWMLYHFDLQRNVARNFVVIRQGEYPLYDLHLRILDLDTKREIRREWGELNAPAAFLIVEWPLPPTVYFRIFFHARNGSWHQDLLLRRSEAAACWLAATRVLGRKGEVLLEHFDNEYLAEFGPPTWRG